jgi:hypothetical protein
MKSFIFISCGQYLEEEKKLVAVIDAAATGLESGRLVRSAAREPAAAGNVLLSHVLHDFAALLRVARRHRNKEEANAFRKEMAGYGFLKLTCTCA